MTTAPTSGARRPRMTTMPSSSLYMCRARLLCRRAVSRASAISSTCRQPRTYALDVLGGAGFADLEQALLGFRRRHTRESADLRVRQLTAGEGVRQARQGAEGARHADALAGGTGVQPDAPPQPRGARAEAGV